MGAAMAWGYGYGILRANIPDGLTHFLFDAAVGGLYVACFFLRPTTERHRSRLVRPWVVALVAWPTVLLLVPYQHPLVQLVGYRAAVFFLPMLLIGARLEPRDLVYLARILAGLNLVALAFALLEMRLGVERFYPYNAVTDLIYRSRDVGAGELRIPACFPNAHAYGGTMVATLPVILGGVSMASDRRERVLLFVGAFAAALGTFICAARQPVIYLFALGAMFLAQSPFQARWRAGGVLVVTGLALAVLSSERLQRFTTLSDTEMVADRLSGSANLGFFQMLADHPLGEGLASAAGTSVPFFLGAYAKPQIGMENEFGRIALEQSLLGLGLWVGFIVATALRWPRRHTRQQPWRDGTWLMWAWVSMLWASAFVGTGMLTSIPMTLLLLLEMGCVWRALPRRAPTPRAEPATTGRLLVSGADRG